MDGKVLTNKMPKLHREIVNMTGHLDAALDVKYGKNSKTPAGTLGFVILGCIDKT